MCVREREFIRNSPSRGARGHAEVTSIHGVPIPLERAYCFRESLFLYKHAQPDETKQSWRKVRW